MTSPVVPPQTPYVRALRDARTRGHAIGRAGVSRLRLQFENAADRLSSITSESPLVSSRALTLGKQINATLRALTKDVATETETNVRLTVDQLAAIHYRATRDAASRVAGVNDAALRATFDAVPIRALAAMNSRRGGTAHTFRTIYNRHVEHAASDLDTLLGSGIARGVSANVLAKDVASLLLGEEVTGLRQMYGLRPTDVSGLKTLWYDARRIAVSEINNAMREANAQSMRDAGIIAAARWQLSGAHPEEDVCDEIAQADDYGFGPGMYPPDEWPIAPHPFCACMQGGPVVYHDPGDWPAWSDASDDNGPVVLGDTLDEEGDVITAAIKDVDAELVSGPENPFSHYVPAKTTDVDGFDYANMPMNEFGGSGDLLLGRLYREQGFDGLPRVTTDEELDKLIDEHGATPIWRGVRGEDYVRQYMEGEYFPGLGIYGNGTYTAVGEVEDSSFKGALVAADYSQGEKNGIMRMVLKPDARVAVFDELERQMNDEMRVARNEAFYVRPGATEEEMKFAQNKFLVAYQDIGRYATARGYDAIHVTREDYMVVLNRTATVVARQPYSAEEIEAARDAGLKRPRAR